MWGEGRVKARSAGVRCRVRGVRGYNLRSTQNRLILLDAVRPSALLTK